MALSKRLRFEVFKRDSFTCQYCGRKAPDVILHVDHVDPKSGGGSDDLLNLVTSCLDCNSGKGPRRLSDQSALEKQRAQLEELQERREQIDMMMQWQRELVGLDQYQIDEAARLWTELTSWGLNDNGKKKLSTLLRRHGFAEVVEAMRISASQYLESDEKGFTQESVEHAFNKLKGIISVRQSQREKPHLKDLFYIRGILRNRLNYVRDWDIMPMLEEAYEAGASIDLLKRIARYCTSWTNWSEEMRELVAGLRGGYEEGEQQ